MNLSKFNIDKRIVEYSALARSEQMTRDKALAKMQEDPQLEDEDMINLVCERLEISREEMDKYIALPVKSFRDYPTYYNTIRRLRYPIKLAAKMGFVPNVFYLKYAK